MPPELRRLRAAIRKYKLSGLALFSALGLGSVYAVNLAGFLVFLPRSMWGLLDASFIASYFLRFSTMLALAFLAARFASLIISSFFSVVFVPISVVGLAVKKSGRRFIRVVGYRATVQVGKKMLLRHDARVRDGDVDSKLEVLARQMYSSAFLRMLMALAYIGGRVRGEVEYRVDYYSIPLQLTVVLMVLSAVFTTVQGSLILLAIAFFMAFVLPPTLADIYFQKPFFEANVALSSVLKFYSSKLVTIQKITLMALTLSFVAGVLHHKSLVEESRSLEFSGVVDTTGSLVMASSSGFVIYSAKLGYRFVPIEGTQIKLLGGH